MLNIAIVNDSIFAVEVLRRIIKSCPEYQVIWIAYNGIEAVEKCILNPPDLILMDLLMPKLDGVEGTHKIMQASPCAILIVTASINQNAAKVFEAMGYGALDVVNTPILGLDGDLKAAQLLLRKIKIIATLLGKSSSKLTPKTLNYSQKTSTSLTMFPPLTVIGASTGGPKAVATILSKLPPDFPQAVVVVQHIDAEFVPELATWLSQQTTLKVNVAKCGSQPQPGQIFLATTNHHLILDSEQNFRYTPEPRSYFYRPSVDVFFRSVAKNWPRKGVGILLTGMGQDGAIGLGLLRSAGWHTIAQDCTSSVVYGMPKAAVEMGAAVEVLPVDTIASRLLNV